MDKTVYFKYKANIWNEREEMKIKNFLKNKFCREIVSPQSRKLFEHGYSFVHRIIFNDKLMSKMINKNLYSCEFK